MSVRKGGGQAAEQKEKNNCLRDQVRLEDEFSTGTRKLAAGKCDYQV